MSSLTARLLGRVSDKDDKGTVGRGGRFFKLAGMTASVAGNYARSQVKSAFLSAEAKVLEKAAAHQINGERIAETLGELKGAVMKVGQMASIATDILPKEMSDALGKLQREAPPMPFSLIESQIRSEFGASPESLFSRFDPEPFAAASIGQVHRARTDDGREVIVKVQYPGVDESCDSDLAHLKIALRASGLIKMERKTLNAVLRELRDRLHEELDYCNEADNVRLFGKFHAQHDFMVIPRVVGERSSQRVLTLTYEPGDQISELDAKGYSQDIRDKAGLNLSHMFCSQLVELQSIHADPNPANFAFRPDGRIVLYDFGCVKKVNPQVLTHYMTTLKAALDADYEGVEAGMIALEARNLKNVPHLEPEFYEMCRNAMLTPFLQDTPFDYAQSRIHEEVIKIMPKLLKRITAFQAPPEVLLIDRSVLGHYGNLRNMKARVSAGKVLKPYIAQALETTPD